MGNMDAYILGYLLMWLTFLKHPLYVSLIGIREHYVRSSCFTHIIKIFLEGWQGIEPCNMEKKLANVIKTMFRFIPWCPPLRAKNDYCKG